MSTNVYKVSYECDCGVHYGSCGAKCAMILVSHNTCDVYHLLQTDGHGKEPTTGLIYPCFGDNAYSALSKVLMNGNHREEKLTDAEREAVRNRHNL